MKAIIFLGPSLPLDEAKAVLDALYLPPAQQTDLMTAAVNHRPDVIGLIDGVFLQSLSVWHKEILYALDQGIHVYGASSMGALRAAETEAFGMVGIGKVYRLYASGELLDDEEVALGHATADQGYLKISEPMVNVRATFAAVEKAGLLDPATAAQMVAIAKGIYFAERTFSAIFHAAARQGIEPSVIEGLRRFVEVGYVDLKKQDAILLLETIKELGRGKARESARCAVPFRASTAFETLYNRDRRVVHADVSIPLDSIGNYVALHHPDFDALNFNALNRTVAFAFADILGLRASPAELEAEIARLRKRRRLDDDQAFADWMATNHLNAADLDELMTQIVLCRRIHRWFLMANWMERSTKMVLDELRLTGGYREWLERAATQQRLLEAHQGSDGHSGISHVTLSELVEEHCAWTGTSIEIDPVEWSEEAGFHTVDNLKMELSRARSARRALMSLLAESMPSDEDGTAGGAPGPD